MDSKVRSDLITRLKSGKYTHCAGSLRRTNFTLPNQEGEREDTYCALGVLVDMFIDEHPHSTVKWDGLKARLSHHHNPTDFVCLLEYEVVNMKGTKYFLQSNLPGEVEKWAGLDSRIHSWDLNETDIYKANDFLADSYADVITLLRKEESNDNLLINVKETF